MLDNKIFRLLFDTRGTINRREYWASLILLLMVTAISQIGTLSSFFNNIMSTKFMTDDFYLSILISGLLSMLQPEFIPYVFIVLFSSFVVTIKRCRALGFSKYKGWLLGLFTYLLFLTLRALPYMGFFLYNFPHDIDSQLGHPAMIWLAVFSLLFILSGIAVIMLLSRKTKTDNDLIISAQYDSFKYIFDLWKLLVLLFTVVVFISTVYVLFSSGGYSSITELVTYVVALAFITLIYLCFYIRLSLKRAIDAGVSITLFVGILFTYVTITALIVYLLYQPDSSYQSIILSAFIPQIYYFLVSLITALGFVLIALPSKERGVILDVYPSDDEKG